MVKIATTKAQRKLFFNPPPQGPPGLDEMLSRSCRQDLKVRPEDVLQMESRFAGADVSFSATPADGEEHYVPEDSRADSRDALAELEHENGPRAAKAR
jgi:RNA polymerase sigma-32 factor